MAVDDEQTPYWRQCELAWAAALRANGYLVTRLMDNVGNATNTSAPLIEYAGERLRAPDLETKLAGVSAYWEVKFRSRPETSPLTGQSEYWMSYDAARHYHRVRELSGSPVWIVLFDASAAGDGTRWMQASIVTLFDAGRRETRTTIAGETVDALVWPASCMDIVSGPPVVLDLTKTPVLPEEDGQASIPLSVLAPIERSFRRSTRVALKPEVGVPPGVYDVLRHDAQVGLDVLRQQLGIPTYPRYSVLRIGLQGLDIDEVLGLLRYGIRLFLVTSSKPPTELGDVGLSAFAEARLLEWAVVPDLEGIQGWWVDGRGVGDAEPKVKKVLDKADEFGNLNLGQYRIVHADHGDDVLVTAGAGTGKTETMSERIVYLLATNILRADVDEARRLFDLRLDEIALITFTREAAAEMRRRIARTLMLRQRLCDKCVLPATPWLMQLSSTDIDTIHSYAKKIIQRNGSTVGFSPGFAVSAQTMRFRRLVQVALSDHLDQLYSGADDSKIPPEFEFVQFIEEVWHRLGANGLSPLELVAGVSGRTARWGGPPGGTDGHIAEVCRQVINDIAPKFTSVCIETQKIPISELVATATAVLVRVGDLMRRAPRYIFVDEFQDTDAEQMDMVLGLRRFLGSRLFVVGDEKQGIYRFRGAQGSAFQELIARVEQEGLQPFSSFGLTKNFRSGRLLLDSLHPWFNRWGTDGFLAYKNSDRLDAGSPGSDKSSKTVQIGIKGKSDQEAITVRQVRKWLEAEPSAKIAVLCRRNSQAITFQRLLRNAGVPCELRVGGEFFQTRAVVEVRVLLQAVLDPDDDAALLELCETRWFSGIASAQAPTSLNLQDQANWGESFPAMLSWRDRVASSYATGSFERRDLDALRRRVRCLARLLQLRPTLAWLLECSAMFQPKLCRIPSDMDDIELHRYQRCFDHLVAQLDNAFADAPISPHLVLEWLRNQMATNTSEDEPPVESNSTTSVTALTVHKAKGLEFDYVILPQLKTVFGAARMHNEIAVIGQPDGSARLLWKWKPRGSPERTNVTANDRDLWDIETQELIREEARLLYVAMTRARSELVMLVPNGAVKSPPQSWADLVKGV
jgi:superfamily I DNA/RNA helicase